MNSLLPKSGVFPALWMPTDANGVLIESAVRSHARFLHEAGAQGLMVLGSTGEFVFFSPAERAELLRKLADLAGPLPLLANISDINPSAVALLARAARDAGCVSVAILPPWYYPISQADLLEFFLRAAEAASPLPVFLYNFPERVGTAIALETMAAFADRAPLAGIKLSAGPWELHREAMVLARERGFSVLTGWDTRLADAMALGCSGCISGLSNFAPEPIVAAFRAMQAGDPAAAVAPTARLRELASVLAGLNFPHDVAAGMDARGFETGVCKQAMSEETRRLRAAATSRLQTLFATGQ
ncbi:MAG: dihydrodipicolinate synthase family protein [Verrucomicrobiales bacterium]|nr:dihydrodipicolinate synthase family protein [Verrucomicrobiales bacterium]